MVWSCAATSESVFGRLVLLSYFPDSSVFDRPRWTYYFSTHGCMRLASGLLAGAFDELAAEAAACRAFKSKKVAIVVEQSDSGVEVEPLNGGQDAVTRCHASRNAVQPYGTIVIFASGDKFVNQ